MNDEIDSILGVQASPQREARGRKLPIPLDGDRRYVRKPIRRTYHNASRTSSAVDALRGLPASGETWHYLMPGSYDSFDLIDAMLEHAGDASINDLYLATLGFNASNARRLIEMLNVGKVGRCCMVTSTYYESDHKEADTCYKLAQELPRHGGWYCATRSHAKIIAAAFDDGRHFVIESSANLRSCRNLEQFAISHDAGLFDFHRTWMEEVYREETDRRSSGD
jgi:hypothetical protein